MATLTSQLAKRGHTVTLITLDDGQCERHQVDDRVGRRRLDVMSESGGLIAKISNTRRRISAVREAIKELSPDVLLSFCDRTNVLALMATKRLGLPVVISERSDPRQQNLGRAWEFARGRTYRRATAMIALTETSASYLSERFGCPVDVIPSAVDPPPIVSDRQQAKQNRRIIGIGRLEQEKGFDRLIEAFAKVGASHPDWTLKILGEGSLRGSLQELVEQRGLQQRVELAGWVRPVWEELAGSTIFALPSRYEGFPSALLEAMAVGVPSVAVDCESGPRAVITEPGHGLLVPDTVQGLTDGIEQLINDGDLRETLAAGGKDVVTRFSWDTMVDAYEGVLRRVTS